MEYNLIIDGKPIPASRPRVSRWSTYYNEPYNSYKGILKDKVSDSIPKDKRPLYAKYEPLEVTIIFYMQYPKSLSKKKKDKLYYHVKKPDGDNLEKAILDAMNGIVYHDDGQVCDVIRRKRYSNEPRTEVHIRKLDV